MFTVCPKCALTLVVTASDLKVAQGYVRCGRCSNVFNAIVGLSEGGGTAQTQSTPQAASNTASTSIIRKAPSISDDDPPPDPLSDTGENEPIYAEPGDDTQEVSVQDVFADTGAPLPVKPVQAKRPSPTPPPATTARAPAKSPPPPPQPEPQAFSDSIPDVALEFNPEATDVSQVFIEAAPPKKIDLRPPEPPPPRQQQRPPPPERPAARQPPPPPRPRDAEDLQIEDELRSLAARLDATGKQQTLKPDGKPAARKPQADAANQDSRPAYSGSPYNSADEPANVARKAAANATRRSATKPGAGAKGPATDTESFNSPPLDETEAAAAASELTPRRRSFSRGQRLAWIGGSIALGLGLAAQAIHHNRHELATKPSLNRPLTRFYEAIGVPLVPRWNLASYDVRQLGAVSDPGGNGNLTVRASLKNAADQPLPMPLLRITVQDRYGNRIATRDVPPKGYAPGAVPERPQLGAGQRIDAEVTFKDPGRDAVGFEIDACLPTPEGRVACANEAPTPR